MPVIHMGIHVENGYDVNKQVSTMMGENKLLEFVGRCIICVCVKWLVTVGRQSGSRVEETSSCLLALRSVGGG